MNRVREFPRASDLPSSSATSAPFRGTPDVARDARTRPDEVRSRGRRAPRVPRLGTLALVLTLSAGLLGCQSSSPENRAMATMREAVAAMRSGDPARAEELALRAKDERPGFVDPLFLAASIRERDGRFESARDAYREILATDATSGAAAIALAQTFVSERRLDEAEDWLRRALEEDPGAEAAVFNLGSIAEERGAPDDAAAWFELSAALDPRDPRAPTRIARIRLAQGRREDARRAAEDALRRAPEYAQARVLLAEIDASRR